MKNILVKVISLLLLLSVLTSCGTYNPPNNPGGNPNDNPNPNPNPNPDPEGEPTTVFVTDYRGMPFEELEGEDVIFSDGFSVYTAELDAWGEAEIKGLDGDFRVTLDKVPEGYTYNPNVYTVTNDQRDITITLYAIESTKNKGTGDGLYGDEVIKINSTGMYSATVEEEGDVVYYEFTPTKAGEYSVEAWVDVTKGEINPKLEVYYGSFAAKWFDYLLDDGGAASGYTKNFRYTVQIDKSEVGNAFTFGVTGTTRGEYPFDVHFAVQLDGEFYRDKTTYTMIVPEELETSSKNCKEYGTGYTFVGSWYDEESPNAWKKGGVIDGTKYKLNPETGVYHRYDEETGTYGEVLYAFISQPTWFIDMPFTTVEAPGNKNLTVNGGKDNYKMFIEGYDALATCFGLGPHEWYSSLSTKERKQYEDIVGYGGICNSDGACPVTAELKEFLQQYSLAQRLFADGQGWAENNGTYDIDAREDDQWLFACGFYLAEQ